MNPGEREALIRTSTDAWNSNDFETLKAIWSPEGVIVSPEGWPEVGTFSGWDAMLAQWRRIKESWAEERVAVTGIEPAGEASLADMRWELRGEASGAPLEVRVWMLCEFEGRRLAKMSYFLDERAARAAAEEKR